MESKLSKEMDLPASQDVQDLKLIKGIGPKVEKQLNAAGIASYAQLAGKTSDELASALNNLAGFSAERIDELDWINEARKLSAKYELPETEPSSESRQHYAVFTVELLLDEENNVRRTRAMHVQSQNESTWAGWEQSRLENFVFESAGLNIPPMVKTPQKETSSIEMETPVAMPVESPQGTSPGTFSPPSAQPQVSSSYPGVTGELRLGDLSFQKKGSEGSQKLIGSNQSFNVKLPVDLVGVDFPGEGFLNYTATIYAKKFGSTQRRVVGNTAGKIIPADRYILDVKDIKLPQGIYRIEAIVKLMQPGTNGKKNPGLMAMTEGSLVHVY